MTCIEEHMDRGGRCSVAIKSDAFAEGVQESNTWCWMRGLQKCERIHFCCRKPPRLSSFVNSNHGKVPPPVFAHFILCACHFFSCLKQTFGQSRHSGNECFPKAPLILIPGYKWHSFSIMAILGCIQTRFSTAISCIWFLWRPTSLTGGMPFAVGLNGIK